jgi:hypothetical protein
MPDGSLDTYERQVKRDRAALAASLETLSQIMEPERLKGDVTETAKSYGQQVWSVARDNPAAFALLGVGATLLATGLGHRAQAEPPQEKRTPTATPPENPMKDFDTRVAAADRAMGNAHTGEPVMQPPNASRMRRALRRGLEKFPPDAQRRILQARLAALQVQERLERRAGKLSSQSAETVRKHPIETASLAFGLGVLGAIFMPGTKTEDRLLGAKRDELMQTARDTMQREIEAMKNAARSAEKSFRDTAPNVPS